MPRRDDESHAGALNSEIKLEQRPDLFMHLFHHHQHPQKNGFPDSN